MELKLSLGAFCEQLGAFCEVSVSWVRILNEEGAHLRCGLQIISLLPNPAIALICILVLFVYCSS